jgi:hypothetical protein
MFAGATSYVQNISTWNVSGVLNMANMFAGATSFAATAFGSWAPTACTNMNNMFRGTSAAYTNTTASGRFNINLTGWPKTASSTFFFSPNGSTDTTTSDINSPFLVLNTSMTLNFSGTPSITLPISGAIDTILVDFGNGTPGSSLSGTVSGQVKVYGTFTTFGIPAGGTWTGASSLLSVATWPSTLTSLSSAFYGASSLTSVPVLPTSVTNLASTFFQATAFNQNISSWNVSNVLTMVNMFNGATAYTAPGISTWTPTACTNMSGMFRGANGAYSNTSSS